MKNLVLGIDIGGTHLRMGAVDVNGSLESFEKVSSAPLREGNGPENLVALIHDYLCRYAFEPGSVKAVSISIPGTVRKDKEGCYSAPYLSGFARADLRSWLEKRLCIATLIDRDANFLLLSDIERSGTDLSGTEHEMLVGLYYGSAVANAFYLNGHFYDGARGVAGEISHNQLYGLEERDVCGNTGCVGLRCGGKYLVRLAQERFPDIPFEEIFEKRGDTPELRQFIQDMAIPITQIAKILDPAVIFIAGGVVDMRGFPQKQLDQAAREHMRHSLPADTAKLVFTHHSDRSGVLGAALYAHRQLGAAK